jgi:NDP-sugar pyrophosphorylase family protein
MAGGRGSRLGLLTQKTPKPLINVAGEPILHRILKSLSSFGFQDIYISVNYLADQIIDSVADGKVFGLNVAYVFEDSPMGTAGAIGKIKGIEDFENLLVMNADLVADIDFSKLLDYHGQNHLDLTVVARENVTQVPYGVLKILNGFVQGVEEKPTYTDLISAGVYVLSKKIFGLIPNQAIDMPDLINMAAALGSRVGAFPIHLQWIDIGNPEDLDRAQQYLGDVS